MRADKQTQLHETHTGGQNNYPFLYMKVLENRKEIRYNHRKVDQSGSKWDAG